MKKNLKLKLIESLTNTKTKLKVLLLMTTFFVFENEGYAYFQNILTSIGNVEVGSMDNWDYPLLMVDKGEWYPVVERVINGGFEDYGGFEIINGRLDNSASIADTLIYPLSGNKFAILGTQLLEPKESTISWTITEKASDFLVYVNFLTDRSSLTSKTKASLVVNNTVKDAYEISDLMSINSVTGSTESGYVEMHADLRGVSFPATIKLIFSPDKDYFIQKDLLVVDNATTNIAYGNEHTLFKLKFRNGLENTHLIDYGNDQIRTGDFTFNDGKRIITYYAEIGTNSSTKNIETVININTEIIGITDDLIVRLNIFGDKILTYSKVTSLSPVYYFMSKYADCTTLSGTTSGILKKKKFIHKLDINETECLSLGIIDAYGNRNVTSEIHSF